MLAHKPSCASFDLSFVSSNSRVSPPPFSSTYIPLPALSSAVVPSTLLSSFKNLNLGRRWNLLHRVLRTPTAESSDSVDAREEAHDEYDCFDVSDDDDERAGEKYSVDIEALEEEAKAVAREYSISLSRELTASTFSLILI